MRRRQWSRRYPPLFGVVVAALLAVFVLPSALNVPQSNPTQTLEFAPIPPGDDDPPLESSNLESLGLGSSSTTVGDAPGGEGGGGGGGALPPQSPEGIGDVPVTKRCVGNPPRQSEDPLAPPCVAHFEGDNGGATYQGVTADEVRLVIARDAFFCTPSENGCDEETQYAGETFDLARPPEENPSGNQPEPGNVRVVRRFQAFFNTRYQAYGRSLHFYVHYMSNQKTPETRRADAALIMDIDPFATVTAFNGGLEGDYTAAMAQGKVLTFGSSAGQRDDEYFARFPGLVWSMVATVERSAKVYSSFVCDRVVGQPVVDSGNADENGGPRTLGYLRPADPQFPNLQRLAQIVHARLVDCGAVFADDRTFSVSQRHAREAGLQAEATQNMAAFQNAGVTTIVVPGGMESNHSHAGAQLDYRPEWVLFGEGATEGHNSGRMQEQSSWRHAWMATQRPMTVPIDERQCARATREADPSAGRPAVNQACARGLYEDIHQLVTGIQVAGPKLTPQSLERGFRAIPAIPSDDPTVPACFYVPGDYTCVKDGTIGSWDPDGRPPSSSAQGCWRMVQGGLRHLPGQWPRGNLDAHAEPDDPCNDWAGPLQLYVPS